MTEYEVFYERLNSITTIELLAIKNAVFNIDMQQNSR